MPIIQVVRIENEHHSDPYQHRHFSDGDLTPPSTSLERLRLGITYSSCTMSEAPQDPIDLTPDEANRIIHSHRKVRYGELSPRVGMWTRDERLESTTPPSVLAG